VYKIISVSKAYLINAEKIKLQIYCTKKNMKPRFRTVVKQLSSYGCYTSLGAKETQLAKHKPRCHFYCTP